MKTLGVVGGLGPMATAYFYEQITAMTDAKTDQQHIDMIIYSIPSTPDRTAYLLGSSTESPLPRVLSACERLDTDGVACIAIPCVTMSCFIGQLRDKVSAPIIDMVEETVEVLKNAGIRSAGIMATDGTVQAGRFQRALSAAGITPVLPDEAMQKNVMHVIYSDVKNNRPVEMDKFGAAADYLRANGAECIILGCTELSVVKRDNDIGSGFIDAMDVLAQCCIKRCGAPVDPKYHQLIS